MNKCNIEPSSVTITWRDETSPEWTLPGRKLQLTHEQRNGLCHNSFTSACDCCLLSKWGQTHLLLQVTHQLLHFKNPNVVTGGDSGRSAGRSCLLSVLIFTSHPFLGQKIKERHTTGVRELLCGERFLLELSHTLLSEVGGWMNWTAINHFPVANVFEV
jgi:hypothetical protein